MQKYNEKLSFFKVLFDAVPISVFIIDQAGDVAMVNKMGQKLLRVADGATYPQSGGLLFHCIHSTEPGGCGSTVHCHDCIIRNTARTALAEEGVIRNKGYYDVWNGTDIVRMTLLITAAPLLSGGKHFVAVIAEDVSNVTELGGLLPICCSCHSIRNGDGYWTRLEEYIRNHSEADFTHDICPDCERHLKRQIS